MRKVEFNVTCKATYKSELEIPDDYDINSLHDLRCYILDHLDEAAIDELDWLSDLEDEDAVEEEDIRDYIDDDENSILDKII